MSVININELAIANFYKNDVLDFKTYPDDKVAKHYQGKRAKTCLDVSGIHSKKLREEIKLYMRQIISDCYTSDYIVEMFFFVEFVLRNQFDSILDFTKDEIEDKYVVYRNRTYTRHIHYFIRSFYERMKEHYDTRTGFDRDIWKLSEFKIDSKRFNKAAIISTLNFTRIEGEANRELVKLYLRFLVGNTTYSISCIMNTLSQLSQFCNDVDFYLLDITPIDFDNYVQKLKAKEISDNLFNKTIASISGLYDYLIVHKKFKELNPVNPKHYVDDSKECIYTAISDYVIFQMFNHLHLLPFNLMVAYLINFSTGLRISDVCQLRTDCLFQTKDHYFIKHKVQKMKKEQINIIPNSVALLIQKQIEEVKKENKKQIYLFPAIKDSSLPMKTEYYRKNMRKIVSSWNIKEEDGSKYKYRSHAYRHSIATTLINDYKVDLAVVQLGVLGHTQINMSLKYAERREGRKKHYQTDYIDNSGYKNPAIPDNSYSTLSDWIEANIESQSLPNGLCTYPRKLGVCPHYDACLSCEYFRTSIKYLDVHKEYLKELEEKIPVYESNGWINNLETAKLQRDNLKKIINGLEQIQKGEEHGSKNA